MALATLPANEQEVPTRSITAGVDTHLDVHVAAALDSIGGLLGTASFATTPVGYRQLLAWLRSFGEVVKVGVEGTGSYGAGLTRVLQHASIQVVEVDRPNRQDRRRVGKSDTLDAIAAARAALAGAALGQPKTKSGLVEGVRVLTVARQSSTKARTQALNQIRSIVSTAPEELREQLRSLSIGEIVELCAAYWSDPASPDTDLVTTMVVREESVCRHRGPLSSAAARWSSHGSVRSRSPRSRRTSASPSPAFDAGWRRPTSTRASARA